MAKKILFYRWKAYNYLDIRQAFEKEGYEVTEVYQKLESYDIDRAFAAKFDRTLVSEPWAFVFTVNYFAVISDACKRRGVPYVAWTCDNPLISMYHESVFNENNFIFSFDRTNVKEFQDMGVEHMYYLPLAANPDRLQRAAAAPPAEGVEPSLYENTLSFAGSLYERNSYDRLEPKLPDYLKGYFDGIMEMQADLYGANMLEEALTPDILAELSEYFTLEKTEGSFSNLSLVFSTTVLGFKVAQKQRKEGLLALTAAGLPVSIYSNSDTSDLIGISYKGGLEYWTELPKMYRHTAVNLNFTIPNIVSGIPLRVFDILGSGGFCLTNYQAELPEYFTDGQDIAIFYGREDLVEKAKYYAAHDSQREIIAARGARKVAEQHTVGQRIKKLLETLKTAL